MIAFIIAGMTLQQLRILREIARQSLNLSAAALALHTSQPGVSRQVQLLERELGVDLLVRRRNRILGFTATGQAILDVAQALLTQAENIRLIAEEKRSEAGRLTVATSHLHARYTLLAPIKAFSERHPGVQLQVLQADPDDIARLVESAEADIGISTETGQARHNLVLLPGAPIGRIVIFPKAHPLARRRRIALRDLAQYPIIGYHPRSRGGQIMGETFRAHGIDARFVVSASDSDVIKSYVAAGMGIAVIPALAFDPHIDKRIGAVDVTQHFPRTVTTVCLRRDVYLRSYLTDFIQMVVPRLTRERVLNAMSPAQ